MKNRNDETMKVTLETNRRYEVREMHLFDTDASEEKALCGVDASADDRRGVDGYLEDRLNGVWVGAVCEGCKALAAPFAVKRIRDYGGRGPAGRGGGASPTRRHTLAGDRPGTWLGLEGRPTHPYVRPFLRLRGCGRSPSPASHSLLGEQMAKAQIVRQVQERCKVAYAGPHPLIPPATYRVGVGSETAVYLRPRQVGLLLEPHQALREVVGKDVGSSAVVCALSRHSANPSHVRPQSPPRRDVQAASRGVRKQPDLPPPQDLGRTQAGRGRCSPLASPYAGFSVARKAKRCPPARPIRPARRR